MAKLGKRAAAAKAAFEGKSNLTVEEAVSIVKSNAGARFDETGAVAVNLGVDPRHAAQIARGVVGLPTRTGTDVRVAVFARGPTADPATAAGADPAGTEARQEHGPGGRPRLAAAAPPRHMAPARGLLGDVLAPRQLLPPPPRADSEGRHCHDGRRGRGQGRKRR